ncbi:MAG: PilC/PilY family type IV pilus protein [Arenicellales bacterium]
MSTHSDYDQNFNYPRWSILMGPLHPNVALADGEYVFVDRLLSGDCTAGYVQGNRGSMTSCLKLPDNINGSWQYSRHYLDFLFNTFASGTDLSQPQQSGEWLIPRTSVLHELKQAATELVTKLEHVRLCLASFGQDTTGINFKHSCSENNDIILQSIATISLNNTSYSPLSQAYQQIWNYFRGQFNGSQADDSILSPVQYRCQGNAIIMVSDGLEYPDEAASANSPQALILTAQRARQVDLLDANVYDDAGKSFGSAEIPIMPNTEPADRDFSHQNLTGFFVSADGTSRVMTDAAEHSGGIHVGPKDTDLLSSVIQRTLRRQRQTQSSVAPLVSNIDANGRNTVYQTIYDPATWSGSIQAYNFNTTVNTGDFNSESAWGEGAEIPDYLYRNIFTAIPSDNSSIDSSALVPTLFQWDQLQDVLPRLPGYSEEVLSWLRGDPQLELSNGGVFRDRAELLGDIVHSYPAILPKTPNQNYPDADYLSFASQMSLMRSSPIVFVGANDGMLHGFSEGSSGAEEVFAYVPWTLLPELPELSDPDYRHRFFFDGPITLVDARISTNSEVNAWHTVLLATFGAGAKGMVALDVTDPDAFDLQGPHDLEKLFLWEISPLSVEISDPSNSPYSDMGHLLSPASVIRVKDSDQSEHWFAVTGNGVGSQSNKSTIYIINLDNGTPHQLIDVPPDRISGITSVTAADLDDDSFVDRLYAADLSGNVWRFDWMPELIRFESFYKTNNSPSPLFSASEKDMETEQSSNQAISSGFEIGQLPGKGQDNGIILYFGTGKNFAYSDLPGTDTHLNPTNSIYGVWDSGQVAAFDRSRLVQQQINTFDMGQLKFRTIDGRSPHYDIDKDLGWVIDLTEENEKVTNDPALLHERIQFTTTTRPSEPSDPCVSAPEGWLLEIDAVTGGNPESHIFDINFDYQVDELDHAPDDRPVAGVQPDAGSPAKPIILELENNGSTTLTRLSSDTNGELVQSNTPVTTKRLSWRTLE